ncbi:MAG: glutaredoxin domain-containing protein [Rhodocyclaceae bacterium]|nr:glutaredoxin domain-containing protein [Rhodocyclaceae bacterium]MDP2195219.1 glutaredoxin domain-containing protein [Rhodocyclaceae bacterium]
MKFVVRFFFRTLRVVIGPFMLLWEFVTRPRGLVRPPALQQQVDQACRSLALYQFKTCPFCIKVRQELRRLSLDIECLDAQHDQGNRDDLERGGGRVMVPCLKISDASGASQWLYESGKIIEYLRGRFAP